MSRPYRIMVKKVVEQDVSAADRTTLRLKLDAVLPEERLTELLAETLERHGWQKVGEGAYEQPSTGEEHTVCDVQAREVTTTIEIHSTVREEVQRELRGDTWNWRQMREMTEAELDEVRRREAEKLTAAVTEEQRRAAQTELGEAVKERLEAGAAERRAAVNRVVLEVMGQALKEKAAQLGQVDRVEEQWVGEEYELTIAVSE